MPSPFPGMDPYLEQSWRAVHARLIVYTGDQLQAQLPPGMRVEVEERVYVESTLGAERTYRPDVHVVESRRPTAAVQPASPAAAAVAEPLVIEMPLEETSERFIDIIDTASGGRVITTIELLSPSIKRSGDGQEKYRQKQRDALHNPVNLVEIDLVRAGQRALMVPSESIPPSHRTTYQVCIRRGRRPSAAEVYRVPLRDRLPILPVPLRVEDPDVSLDLQAIVDLCYRNGKYESIEYTRDPDPPLEASDAAWADALLRAKGLR